MMERKTHKQYSLCVQQLIDKQAGEEDATDGGKQPTVACYFQNHNMHVVAVGPGSSKQADVEGFANTMADMGGLDLEGHIQVFHTEATFTLNSEGKKLSFQLGFAHTACAAVWQELIDQQGKLAKHHKVPSQDPALQLYAAKMNSDDTITIYQPQGGVEAEVSGMVSVSALLSTTLYDENGVGIPTLELCPPSNITPAVADQVVGLFVLGYTPPEACC